MVTADVAAAAAEQAAVRARAHFGEQDVIWEDVRVSDPNPVVAAEQELDEHPEYEALILSTLPAGASRWLHIDTVSRIERSAAIRAVHVAALGESAAG